MVKAGVVGGTGYFGVELLRLVAAHGEAGVTAITPRAEAGVNVADDFPSALLVMFGCPETQAFDQLAVVP